MKLWEIIVFFCPLFLSINKWTTGVGWRGKVIVPAVPAAQP